MISIIREKTHHVLASIGHGYGWISRVYNTRADDLAKRAVHGPAAHNAAKATAGTSAGTGASALDAEVDEILAWTAWGEEQPALQTEHRQRAQEAEIDQGPQSLIADTEGSDDWLWEDDEDAPQNVEKQPNHGEEGKQSATAQKITVLRKEIETMTQCQRALQAQPGSRTPEEEEALHWLHRQLAKTHEDLEGEYRKQREAP